MADEYRRRFLKSLGITATGLALLPIIAADDEAEAGGRKGKKKKGKHGREGREGREGKKKSKGKHGREGREGKRRKKNRW